LRRYRDAAPIQAFELQPLDTSSKDAPQETKREQKRREKLEQLREAEEMKFSHSLQFNAVPDWSNHYIAYSNLKKQYVARLQLKRTSFLVIFRADGCYPQNIQPRDTAQPEASTS
jgi:hypothetical protein